MTRKMQESGIPYVGLMPQEWRLLRGKYILTKLQRPVKNDDGIVTCFRDGEVTLRSNRREDGFTMSDKEIGYQGVDVGDLVVHGMDGFAGAIGISDSRGKASPVLNVLDSDQDKRFLKYFLRSMAYEDVFTAWSTGIRVRSCDLGWNKLSELRFMIPNIIEQRRIADYLDIKCASVDAAIDAGEKEIQKLKEYKQAVITQAVTMGIDSNTRRVHCDNKWFKTIPESWTVFRIKNVCDIVRGGSPRPIDFYLSDNSDDMNWIMIGDTVKGDKYVRSTKYKITAAGVLSSRIIQPDTLLLTNSMSFGEPYFSAIEGCIHDGWLAFSNYRGIAKEYLYYCLMSEISIIQFENMANGTTVNNLNIDKVKSTYILVPNLEDQIQIVKYLDEKIAIINKLIDKKRSQLDKLVKFKKVLIYTYVTGKKEVPNG